MGFREICIEKPCSCRYKAGYLVVSNQEKTTRIHLSEIESITISTTQAFISSYLMSELAKSKIRVVFCDEKWNPVSESIPLHGHFRVSGCIAKQLEWSVPWRKHVWMCVVQDKIRAQAEVLEKEGFKTQPDVLRGYIKDVHSGDPTNREAAAANLYFSTLFGKDFNRDDDNWLNASLNYGYDVLMSKCAREIITRGYLTEVGIFHRGECNPWNLACDFMEPFRPIIDELVIHSGENDFNLEMRHVLVNMFNETVHFKDGNYKLSSVISLYLKKCIDVLNKEAPASEILSYSLL